MKTVTGRVISTEPISLSKAATLLSGFASSENGATKAISAYLRRASDAFNELKSIHREIKSSSRKEKKENSDARQDRHPAGEPEELVRAKGVDDLVTKGGKVRFRETETMSEKVSTFGQEQDEMKEDKKKKKKKEKKEEAVDGKVKEKLEDELRNEERKKKKRKSYEEVGSEERKSKKKEEIKGD